MDYQELLTFWFIETNSEQRFGKSDDYDQLLTKKFKQILDAAKQGEMAHWRKTLLGRLAEIILLDQFSRNIYRATPDAFAQDAMALALSQEALLHPERQTLTVEQKQFLYMPFMHSESLKIHQQAVVLFSEPGMPNSLKYELMHKKIIERFGRYPHRNQILGRLSTPQEIAFLSEPNSSF